MCDLGGRAEPWKVGNSFLSVTIALRFLLLVAYALRCAQLELGITHSIGSFPKSAQGAAQAATLPGF